MNTFDNEYFDYSELDVNQHFIHILNHFFNNTRNPYKYSLAKKHYEACKKSPDFTPTSRLFNIITGTNLVTTKMIMMYKTPQGKRYKIKKSYLQLIQRQQRTEDRHARQSKTTETSFSILEQSDSLDTDDEDTNEAPTTLDNSPKDSPIDTPTVKNITDPPSTTQDIDDTSINSDLTKHADDIAQNIDTAIATITTTTAPIVSNSDMEQIIQRLIKTETQYLILDLKKKDDLLQTSLKTIHSLHDTIKRLDDDLKNITTKTDQWTTTIDKTLDTITDDLNDRFCKLENRCMTIEQKLATTISSDLKSEMESIKTQVTSSHAHTNKRLLKLKNKTKAFVKQTDEDSEIISDRIFRLEDSVAKLKRQTTTPVKTKLRFDSSSDSDFPPDKPISQTPKRPQTDQPPSSYKTPESTQSSTPTKFQDRSYARFNPDMDYLRKNLHLTCSDTNQILEFYIKLRLAISKGGIHLTPIENITRNGSIADTTHTTTPEDTQNQSNALFTLLANEKYIPATFTMAQNCIRGFSNTMDGFAALKAMLKLIHPVLNKKRPSNVPPVLSEATDIHNYEQNLRNFYLLHKLYSKTQYSALDQSKQFLIGMDDSQYIDAVKRVQNQLDTTEIMKIEVPEDFTLDNIASTILNIHGEYDNDATVIRMARTSGYRPSRVNTFPRQSRNQQKPKGDTQHKFSKTQCHACKQFGHIVTHCRHLPVVLAILQFKAKNEEQCMKVLQQHIANNTVSSKRTFVRALQMAQVLPDNDDSDSLLDDDIIINTLQDNDIDINMISQLE